MTSPARNVAPSVGAVIVAVGGLPTLIVIGVDTELFVPSETVSRITYRPGGADVCEGLAAGDRMPSPKSHEYVRDCPSGSLEPVLEKFTSSGAGPVVLSADASATGAWLDCRYRMRRSLLTPKVPVVSA